MSAQHTPGRTLCPYNGSAAQAWNRGYEGSSCLGLPGSDYAKLYARGRAAAESDKRKRIDMTTTTLSLTLVALADDPSAQVAAQGFTLRDAESHDKDAHALARLSVRGILTETEAKRARSRLMDRIAKDVQS